MAARLCPDPLGELERSPRPLAAKRGPTSKGRGREGREGDGRGEDGTIGERRGGGREGEEKGGVRREERRRGGRGKREEDGPPNADSWIRPLRYCNTTGS